MAPRDVAAALAQQAAELSASAAGPLNRSLVGDVEAEREAAAYGMPSEALDADEQAFADAIEQSNAAIREVDPEWAPPAAWGTTEQQARQAARVWQIIRQRPAGSGRAPQRPRAPRARRTTSRSRARSPGSSEPDEPEPPELGPPASGRASVSGGRRA